MLCSTCFHFGFGYLPCRQNCHRTDSPWSVLCFGCVSQPLLTLFQASPLTISWGSVQSSNESTEGKPHQPISVSGFFYLLRTHMYPIWAVWRFHHAHGVVLGDVISSSQLLWDICLSSASSAVQPCETAASNSIVYIPHFLIYRLDGSSL